MQLGGFLGRLLGPWVAIDIEFTHAIGQKCINTIRINNSSLTSQCRNLKKHLRVSSNYLDNIKQRNEGNH